ncbi:MAG TPA: DUF4388 domain-containing protein [Candidatus Polarisedimenticolaceae bacterium]|nr:DUF4388 domain-containing protein [Candidatus Polarisedimenticolaceae bacterium]
MSRGRLGGDLGALGLPELVQTLTSGRKTARVLLRPGARQAEMWFLDGELVHAATPTRFGDLAVYEMLEWTEGEFVVDYGATSDARSVTQDAIFLVLEGLRRIDERPPCPVPLPAEAGAAPAQRSTRLILGLTAVALLAGAITAAALLVGPDPTAANAAALPPPPPAPSIAPKPAAPPSRKSAQVRKSPPKSVVAAPEPTTPAAPESPMAEEPVPLVAMVPAPLVVAQVEPGPVPSSLVIAGRSSGSGGTITVFVDGEAVLTRGPLEPGAAFGAVIDVPPGEREVLARLRVENGVFEDAVRGEFASGESRTLRITANRVIGSPVKVKLMRP